MFNRFLLFLFGVMSLLHSTDGKEKILSRNRRYLIFPEGSNFQLVYDQDITIPDYSNILMTGVTVGLAWELPTEPFYPESDFMDQTVSSEKSSLFQRRKDVKSNETSTPTSTESNTMKNDEQSPMKLFRRFYERIAHHRPYKNNHFGSFNMNYVHNYNNNNSTNNRNYNHRKNFDYIDRLPLAMSSSSHVFNKNPNATHLPLFNHGMNYYRDNNTAIPFRKDAAEYSIRSPLSPSSSSSSSLASTLMSHQTVANHYPNHYDKFTDYLMQSYFGRPATNNNRTAVTLETTTKKAHKKTNEKMKKKSKKFHVIYPAMGKRNVRNVHANIGEKHFIEYHRNTRYKLYKIIEKYLFAKGYNGTACILKTLCEVGQMLNDAEPGSFLTEIIRVIFSFPIAQFDKTNQRLTLYEQAHHNQANDGYNCADIHTNCGDSIWNSYFMQEFY